jgi:cyclic pyranopterin phosphate synthase
MPKAIFGPGFEFLPREQILSFEEIVRVAEAFHSIGVRKIRLTGGEPLLRAELPRLIGWLSELPDTEIALTTNGSLLSEQAQSMARAGLSRVTVSLDSLDKPTFSALNDVSVPIDLVLEGIEAALDVGLTPVKLNAVIKRGTNDDRIVEFARRFKGSGLIPRFIEYMDVGATNGWKLDEVVSGTEIVRRIDSEMPIEPMTSTHPGEVAKRWRYLDGEGEIGVITSVTRPFCGDCSRARISADGRLYTCLFATQGLDLRGPLRQGATKKDLQHLIHEVWTRRNDRYSEIRTEATSSPSDRVEMSYIGG